jgi:ATP-dependent phosphoenolpyruvate carboxykinase
LLEKHLKAFSTDNSSKALEINAFLFATSANHQQFPFAISFSVLAMMRKSLMTSFFPAATKNKTRFDLNFVVVNHPRKSSDAAHSCAKSNYLVMVNGSKKFFFVCLKTLRGQARKK